jgi:CO2 hydration protein
MTQLVPQKVSFLNRISGLMKGVLNPVTPLEKEPLLDSSPNAEEEYRALVRALRRKRGFGLFFVQATRAKGQEILTNLEEEFTPQLAVKGEKRQEILMNLKQKRIVKIFLSKEDDQLFEKLKDRWERERENVDIFWIEGLGKSLVGYEDMQRLAGWDEQDLKNYSWKNVPPILSHLNLGRERFEKQFNCALVFVVPLFVVRYLLRRAEDFFDWKSGFFEFPNNPQPSDITARDVKYNEYLKLDASERLEKILDIRDLLGTSELDDDRRAELLSQMGDLFKSGGNHEQAELSYAHAFKLKPNSPMGRIPDIKDLLATSELDDDQRAELLSQMGDIFKSKGDYEQAEISYGRALKLKPDSLSTWAARIKALESLGREDEAISEFLVKKLMQHETLLPESAHNAMEVVGVLKAYANVIGAYYENLLYVSDTQFLVLFPFFKYMNGDRSFANLLKHWRHDRINYEFAEYCMKAMFWHGGGGMDAYLDTPEFEKLARTAIDAKLRGNPVMQLVDLTFDQFTIEQARQMCYYSALGQFWNVMSKMFFDLSDAYHARQVTTVLEIVEFVRAGLLAVAALPITYSIEIKGQTYDLIPESAGITFLMDVAVPYVEAVFFRSLPFMGTLSYNAQAYQIPSEQGQFVYGALYADPLPVGGSGIPPTLLMQDMLHFIPDYLMDYYRTYGRGEHDLRVKLTESFQKSMFCVTNAALWGLVPNALDSADRDAQVANQVFFQGWVDRFIVSRLAALQDN